jgi:uncharacterized protein (DUF342 family)
MADIDGYFDIEFNADRTQAFATIHPPRGGGRSTSAQSVVEELRRRGVMYGYRESAIVKGIRDAEDTNAPVVRILIAQGLLPEHGTDAQVMWKLDHTLISQPIPRSQNGDIQLDALPAARLVTAGTVLASVIPARPGSPGKTLTTPLMSVKQTPGRNATLASGVGVRLSEDRLTFVADVDGVVELKGDRLSVYAAKVIEGELTADLSFAGALLVTGGVRGCSVHCQGSLTVRGTVAGGRLRVNGNLTVGRIARSHCIVDGDMVVSGTMMHSEAQVGGRLLGLPGSSLQGGDATAMGGVELDEAGGYDGAMLRIATGIDPITPVRLSEIDAEIAGSENSLQRITNTLRMLTTGNVQNLPPEKRDAVQKLSDQRRGLELRIRELHNSKRGLLLSSKTKVSAAPVIVRSVMPGVQVCLGTASRFIEEPMEGVAFYSDDLTREVMVQSMVDAA